MHEETYDLDPFEQMEDYKEIATYGRRGKSAEVRHVEEHYEYTLYAAED